MRLRVAEAEAMVGGEGAVGSEGGEGGEVGHEEGEGGGEVVFGWGKVL